MAKTKRKRRTKHRGTAAGTVESRGRTGRRPAAGERADKAKDSGASRLARLDRPPTWRSAANRAVLAALLLVPILVLLFKAPLAQAISLAAFAVLIYLPMGYYTDLFLYRRRQRQKAGKPKAGR